MLGVAYAMVAQSLLRNSAEETADPAGEEADAPPPPQEVHVPDVAERLQRTFAEDAVSRLIIHADAPMENVPSLTAPELALIGRCVSFGMKQTINGSTSVYYYTGLVSVVSATAVTLMCVNRYTEADFKVFREREKKACGLATAATVTEPWDFPEDGSDAQTLILAMGEFHHAAPEHDGGDEASAHFPFSFRDVFGNGFGGSRRAVADARGSLAPAVAMLSAPAADGPAVPHTPAGNDGAERSVGTAIAAEASHTRPPHFRTCGGSAGPLPCVGVLRKSIHDVRLGRGPDSSFFALFQDPSKQVMDMHYLRMFVRRYLVHASQGTSLQTLSFHRYLLTRGGCAEVDGELVDTMAREELLALMKADRAIAKERRRMRTRVARREEAIRDYQAPAGIFSDTGFLYLTGLPQGSLLTAATMLFFTLAFSLNFILNVQVFGDSLVQWTFSEVSDYFVTAIVVWAATSFVTMYHALVMRVPSLANAPVLLMRGLCTAGSAVYAMMVMAIIAHCATNEYVYASMRSSPVQSLCSFYEQHQCSGFYAPCGANSSNDPLCRPCLPVSSPATSCHAAMTDQLQRVLVPSFLFAIVMFITSVHSLFLLLRLFFVARAASLTSAV